jgi:deoxyribodipyrimidine photo-lyase
MVVADCGYLRHQKQWRQWLAKKCDDAMIPLIQVESEAVVPVEVASNRREFAARTIRPKIQRHLPEFLKPLNHLTVLKSSLRLSIDGDIDPASPQAALAKLKVDSSVAPVSDFFIGGEEEAAGRLMRFIKEDLADYADGRNEPAANATSHLSPYLHFGQISPLEIALQVQKAAGKTKSAAPYLEELVVRRELSFNFCHFTEDYDSYDSLPAWAKQTLADHAKDARPAVYSEAQLATAQTGDPYWNAAQREMNATGFMHNYMRMYWGKKILEWSATPREGFETTLRLNNRLFLCGRDPNSYAAVAWIYGLHDRPWGPARKVFGTVRYMNAAGLTRKFDMDAYVKRIDALYNGYSGRG